MVIRRLGIALTLGVALTAAACSSDAGDEAASAAKDAGSAASSAVDGAGGATDGTGESGDDGASGDSDKVPTDAPVQELLLAPEEVTAMPMQVADPSMLAQSGAGFELPEGMEMQVDPPECAEAADLTSTLAQDVQEGGLAALMGGGDNSPAAYSVQVLRTSISLDDYKTNWENCDNVTFSGQAVGISGTSTPTEAPEIDGADEVIARVADMSAESVLGEGGNLTTLAYLTEVRGVKVLVGAMTSPVAGGELGPEAEAALADLMTKQVDKVNNAA